MADSASKVGMKKRLGSVRRMLGSLGGAQQRSSDDRAATRSGNHHSREEISWWDRGSLWETLEGLGSSGTSAHCNICDWQGDGFAAPGHSESGVCPECGSVARDRFLILCFVARCRERRYRVLETSPRLGSEYRAAMGRWFEYRASDFDERSHKAHLRLDLQDLDLPDRSVEILLTPHVLEHVPDTDAALREIHRVLVPGGRMFLQVPVQQGETAPPAAPEFHGDNTPVFWRFGPDLTERLRAAGFETTLLCTEGLYRQVCAGSDFWPDPEAIEFDVKSVLSCAREVDLTVVTGDNVARWLALFPGYMFFTWECRKPS